MPHGRRFTYSRWDGTQVGFDIDADSVFSEITDDLLYHGDLNAALRRLMQQGFKDRDGKQLQGLRDVLERLRRRRRDELEKHDLGGVYDDIAQRAARGRRHRAPGARPAARRGPASRATSGARRRPQAATGERNLRLDMLPNDLAGHGARSSRQYDFQSSEAQEKFQELVDKLREQLMQRYVDQMSGADGLDVARGHAADEGHDGRAQPHARPAGQRARSPTSTGFMERFGDFFPENPQTLDELLEVMARRMAAMQAMLNSMTPAQREQLRQLSEQLLEDMDLRWQVDQLGGHLRSRCSRRWAGTAATTSPAATRSTWPRPPS